MFSILAPTILGVIFYSKLVNATKTLAVFVFITFVLEVVIRIMSELEMNNMVFFHLYSFLEFGFISLIYYQLSVNRVWRKMIITALVIFEGFSIGNLLFWEEITHFNSIQRHIELILLLLLFLAYCIKLIYEDRNKSFFENPFFILTGGFMIYFTGTMYLFIHADELLYSSKNYYWIIHGFFNIFLNIVYSIVIWKSRIRI